MVRIRAAEVSELREKIEEPSDDVEAKDLRLQTVPGLVDETTTLRKEVSKLWEVAAESEKYLVVLSGSQEEVLEAKEAAAELLPAVEKGCDLWVDSVKNFRSMEMELSLFKHRKASFDGAMAAVNKELLSARVECVTLGCIREEVLSKLKMLETDLGKSLKIVSERTTEGSSTMTKQFETEVARGPEMMFADFKYEAAKISGVVKTFLSESTEGAHTENKNIFPVLSNQLVSVRESSSDKPSTSVLSTSADAAGTAQLLSAEPSSK